MKIGLLNWSGHKNLGDDAMAEVLLRFFPDTENMRENPQPADWYILGGGTLIAPLSQFMALSPDPERTIGFSLGVSCNWRGEGAEFLKRFPLLYARDTFSHNKLTEYGVDNILSVDLLSYCKPDFEEERKRTKLMANIMYAPGSIMPGHETKVAEIKEELKGQSVDYFAMSPDEDVATIPNATVETDVWALVDSLRDAHTVYATRLHANVLAWISGVPKVVPIVYDPKIEHFYQRVSTLTPRVANKIITEHLSEVYEYIYHGRYPHN